MDKLDKHVEDLVDRLGSGYTDIVLGRRNPLLVDSAGFVSDVLQLTQPTAVAGILTEYVKEKDVK
jgi:hypothetical protein